MTAETVQEMLDRDPFEPFRICVSNGSSYEVRNPHLVALLKNRLFVADAESDAWTFVSYLHIAALETLGRRNGHAKGSKKRGK